MPFSFAKSLAATLAAFFCLTGGLTSAQTLSLQDSVRLATSNNQSIKTAESKRTEAYWTYKQAAALKGPTITFNHRDTRGNTAPDGTLLKVPRFVPMNKFNPLLPPAGVLVGMDKPIINNYQNKLTLTFPLYTGGKLEGLIDQAALGREVSDSGYQAAQQQLRMDAENGYYQVLLADQLVQVSKQTVDSMAAHLNNVQDKFNNGVVGLPDVLQTRVKLADAKNNLSKAEANYTLSKYNLNTVMGQPLQTPLTLTDTLQELPCTKTLEEIIIYALNHRPELKQAQLGVEVQKKGEQVAAADGKPVISALAVQTWSDDQFPGDQNSRWLVGVNVDFNVFDNGRTHANVKKAQAATSAAESQLEKARQDVALQTSAAYVQLQDAKQRIVNNQVTVKQAETSLQLAFQLYNAGVGINLDVMDAEVNLEKARTSYIQALYDYNIALASLQRYMGVPLGDSFLVSAQPTSSASF